jgi:hypothetical protein
LLAIILDFLFVPAHSYVRVHGMGGQIRGPIVRSSYATPERPSQYQALLAVACPSPPNRPQKEFIQKAAFLARSCLPCVASPSFHLSSIVLRFLKKPLSTAYSFHSPCSVPDVHSSSFRVPLSDRKDHVAFLVSLRVPLSRLFRCLSPVLGSRSCKRVRRTKVKK